MLEPMLYPLAVPVLEVVEGVHRESAVGCSHTEAASEERTVVG